TLLLTRSRARRGISLACAIPLAHCIGGVTGTRTGFSSRTARLFPEELAAPELCKRLAGPATFSTRPPWPGWDASFSPTTRPCHASLRAPLSSPARTCPSAAWLDLSSQKPYLLPDDFERLEASGACAARTCPLTSLGSMPRYCTVCAAIRWKTGAATVPPHCSVLGSSITTRMAS